jgi:hypothetical protein
MLLAKAANANENLDMQNLGVGEQFKFRIVAGSITINR